MLERSVFACTGYLGTAFWSEMAAQNRCLLNARTGLRATARLPRIPHNTSRLNCFLNPTVSRLLHDHTVARREYNSRKIRWGATDLAKSSETRPRWRSYSTDQPRTLLNFLRSHTTVDCDTLDVSVAESLGPFEDCTSNQAIAYFELQEHRHRDLVKQSAGRAGQLLSKFPDVSAEALAVEIGVRRHLSCWSIWRLTFTDDISWPPDCALLKGLHAHPSEPFRYVFNCPDSHRCETDGVFVS